MSAYLVSTDSIDLIVQAAFKYRIITKRERTLFGRMLLQVNQQSLHCRYGDDEPTLVWAEEQYPAFTAFPRKFKRTAVHGVIACFDYQSSEWPDYANSEVKRLLTIVREKNAVAAGFVATTENVPAYEDNGDRITDEWGNPEYTTTVTQTATESMIQAMQAAPDEDGFWDVLPAQRDPESEDFARSVMVRPIEIIRAEQEAAREQREADAARIREERMATTARLMADDDADDDDDDWEDLDDDES